MRLILMCVTLLLFSVPTMAGDKSSSPPPIELSAEMKRLIEEIRQEEDKYRYLETQARFSPFPGNLFDVHSIVAGDRFFTRSEFRAGEKSKSEVVESTFDGTQTILIHQGQSVEVFQERHEHRLYAPPHSWNLVEQHVNIPLSTLLSGTAAIHQHPKVVQLLYEGSGGLLEFTKLESTWAGEEMVDGHPCAKVEFKHWFFPKEPPSQQTVWLAKDRNYLPIKHITIWAWAKPPVATRETVTTEFREISPGLYLPQRIVNRPISGAQLPSGEEVKPEFDVLQLTEANLLTKEVAESKIPSIAIPADLPKFTISADKQLIDGPAHPRDLKPTKLTIEEVLERLRTEESRYQLIGIKTRAHYIKMPGNSMTSETEYIDVITERETIREEDRFFNRNAKKVGHAGGEQSEHSDVTAFNGDVGRTLFVQSSKGGTARQGQLNYAPKFSGIVPHMMLINDDDASENSLSDYMTKGTRFSKHTSSVVGEETVNGELCVKIKINSEGSSFQFLWLSIQKNLLPVRQEWHDLGRHKTLPTSLAWTQEFREVAPGVWAPGRMTRLTIRYFEIFGLGASEMAINWRCDTEVTEARLNETHPSELFSQISVPKGTEVYVIDDQGRIAGRFKQPNDGNLELEWTRYLQMREEAGKREEDRKKRIAALDALIGKPVPVFPETAEWLNGEPMTWKSLKGKTVLIDFWAEWCGPCQGTAKELANLLKPGSPGQIGEIVIIGVHTPGSDRKRVEEVAKEWGLTNPIVTDVMPTKDQGGWGQFFSRCQIHQLPYLLVVDRNGNVVAHGDRFFDMLQKAHQAAKE